MPTVTPKLEWTAYDRVQRAHAPDWYWAVGIIALSIAVTAVILDNVLFAVLIVISTVVLFLQTLQKPRLVSYTLTARGIWTDKEFDPYQALESFCIPEHGEPPRSETDEFGPTHLRADTYGQKLLIKAKGLLSPLRIIPLGETSAETVREFLAEYLPEEALEEPLARKIMEHLGF